MYIVQEIQTNGTQTALTPAATFLDRNEADSSYHMRLAAAATSAVQIHTVIMFDEHGNTIRYECYEHNN